MIMNDELERMRKKFVVARLNAQPRTFYEGLNKTMKTRQNGFSRAYISE
jgi:hypothetical protein